MAELFVTCPLGFEALLIEELETFGIKARKSFCGVYVPQSMQTVYTINYCSRLATRVLWPLSRFPCPNREALYKHASKINWPKFLNPSKTFSIDANVISHPNLRNSLFAALVVKDALCDSLREAYDERPSVDTTAPDVQINLFIQNGWATISYDTTGAPLYKRGYRQHSVEAPLQESIAATMLTLAKFSSQTLCDPFCGSGTILIEAAMIASNTPPGFFRKTWGFLSMPQFNFKEWEAIKKGADEKRIPLLPGKIFGSDKDMKAIDICRSHLKATGFDKMVEVRYQDIRQFKTTTPIELIVTNPPYGRRLDTSAEIYRYLGDFIKKQPKASGYVLAPEDSLIKETNLPSKESFAFSNGGFKVKLFAVNS